MDLASIDTSLLRLGLLPGWKISLAMLFVGNVLFLLKNLVKLRGSESAGPNPVFVSSLLLLLFLAFATFSTLADSRHQNSFAKMLNLLSGCFLAQLSAETWQRCASRFPMSGARARALFVAALELPALFLLFISKHGHDYSYHSVRRLTGAFENPNAAGLFAALNSLLLGYVFIELACPPTSTIPTDGAPHGETLPGGPNRGCLTGIPRNRWLCALLGLQLCLNLVALAGSFSRGAWFSFASGLVFLGVSSRHAIAGFASKSMLKSFRFCSPLPTTILCVIALFLALLAIQMSSQAGVFAHRLGSVVDGNDFSGRNRGLATVAMTRASLDAWPAGYGLNDLEAILQAYYAPQPFSTNLAYHLNSFAFIGAGLGLPCLFALLSVIVITLAAAPNGGAGSRQSLFWRAFLCIVCVAFLFNGDIFSFTGSLVFWLPLFFAIHTSVPFRTGALTYAKISLALLTCPLFMAWVSSILSPHEHASTTRIEYTAANGLVLNGCIVTPFTPAPRGLVVFAHGSGNKWFDDGWVLRCFAKNGLACATFDYRSDTDSGFKEDLLAFCASLRRDAALARLPMIWCGDSWGAFEVLSAAIQSAEIRPTSLVCVSGPWSSVDFRIRSEITRLYPPGLLETLSASGQRATPVLFVHGDSDEMFPAQSCSKVGKMLSAAGIRSLLATVPDCGHFPGVNVGVIAACIARQIEKPASGMADAGEAMSRPRQLILTSYDSFLRNMATLASLLALLAGIGTVGWRWMLSRRQQHFPGIALALAGLAGFIWFHVPSAFLDRDWPSQNSTTSNPANDWII